MWSGQYIANGLGLWVKMESTSEDVFFGEERCFIIAEAGVNHDGDIEKAKRLVDAAVDAAVDAVKFQTFKTELIVTESVKQAEYQIENLGKEEGQFSMLKKLELTENDFKELKDYCDKKGIIFLSTPHSGTWSADLLENLDVRAFKISSGDLTNKCFLEYVAKFNKPLILSVGMANLDEINEAVKWVKEKGNNKLILLHCTSSYPCPEERVNLRAMKTLKDCVGCVTGYSDHTLGLETPVIALCLGAKVYEKHFTLNRKDNGPDHKASLEPPELKKMVEAIRIVEENGFVDPKVAFDFLNSKKFNLDVGLIETILGSHELKPDEAELEIAKVSRKSLVALGDLDIGVKLTKDNVGVRRPGEGLPPKYYGDVIGKTTVRSFKKGEYIKLEGLK